MEWGVVRTPDILRRLGCVFIWPLAWNARNPARQRISSICRFHSRLVGLLAEKTGLLDAAAGSCHIACIAAIGRDEPNGCPGQLNGWEMGDRTAYSPVNLTLDSLTSGGRVFRIELGDHSFGNALVHRCFVLRRRVLANKEVDIKVIKA